MEDKNLTCRDCGATFVFSVAEQEFYAEKGFTNEPARCVTCRRARKERTNNGGMNREQREMHTTICSNCGVETQVPFRPTGDRPVYCSDCFSRNR